MLMFHGNQSRLLCLNICFCLFKPISLKDRMYSTWSVSFGCRLLAYCHAYLSIKAYFIQMCDKLMQNLKETLCPLFNLCTFFFMYLIMLYLNAV